jgi:glutathione synthase/RimK-type ligase-like ATP-grasp enzyme
MLLKYFLDDKKAQENFWDEVVLKPIYWNWWIWVELLNTQHILENQKTRRSLWFIYLVQKKIDTTNWYAWITSANHDLRLYYIGNKLVDAVIREKENTGEFKVNVSQWGHARYIDIWKLPNDLSDTAKEIIEEIHPKQKDIFSLDFMYDSNEMKWYLIEMNSNPWFRNINNIEVHEIPLLQAIEEVLRK